MNASKKVNPIESTVAALLEQWGVECRVLYVGERTRDSWKHDRWIVIFKSGVGEEEFEYSTGLGLRQVDEKTARYIYVGVSTALTLSELSKKWSSIKNPSPPLQLARCIA